MTRSLLMNARVRGMLEERGVIVVLALLLSLPLAIGAYASAGHSSNEPKKASTSVGAAKGHSEQGEQGEQAGDTGRVHGTGETCPLPDGVAALSGNWTHGEYVSAWAHWAAEQKQQGLSTESAGASVRTAAQSDCGKPDTAASAGGQNGESPNPRKSADAHSHKDEHKP